MFIWCFNLLGFFGKGYEYMFKYLFGVKNGVMNDDFGKVGGLCFIEVDWVDDGVEGKFDLVIILDFCMFFICMYLDIVLLIVIWYEKDDFNIFDMYFFIYLLLVVIDLVWEVKSDWEIYKVIVKKFFVVVEGYFGVEQDLVMVLLLYDIFIELVQLFGGDGYDWKKGECELVLGCNLLMLYLVECDYLNVYCKFILFGLLLDKLGNGGKGIGWNIEKEVKLVGDFNYCVVESGVSQGWLCIDSVIDVVEVVFVLVLEINGQVVVKVWEVLLKIIGCEYVYLVLFKEDEKICFCDIQVQLCKIIFSLIWFGFEDEYVSYNVGYINVYELILWCIIIGCQQFYQDYLWMQVFGEGFVSYWLLVNIWIIEKLLNRKFNGNLEIILNWIILYQKWGIYFIYSDNLLMFILLCGGLIIWFSEYDVVKVGIVDNDWVEVFNVNGVVICCVVVSQWVKDGMVMMYYVQECIVNVFGSEIIGICGGYYNLVICVVFKLIYMIGGYVQQVWGFNYYGMVGCNCDEFVVVCKMSKVDWLDEFCYGGFGGDVLL